MSSTSALDIRRFIDDRPVSRYQLLVAVMCGLIVFVDGFDAQAMGYVAPALTAAMKISRGVLASVISSGLVGMMIGALVSGPLADRIGRKPVLIGCSLIFGVGSLLTATAHSVESLMAWRAITGLGMGGAMPNAIALTSEYMPRRRRAGAVTMMICGFSLGAAVGGFVAASIIPIVIALASFALLPESIRFLLVRGGSESRARAYLARIAPGDAVAGPLSPGQDEHPSTRLGATTSGAFLVADLFTNGRAMATILIWVIYFMNLLNLYFLNSWLPTIISDAGIPVATAIRLTSLFQIGGIAGAIVLGRLLDRTFSFWILAGCYAWAAAFVYAIGHSGASIAMLAVTIACAGVGIIGGQNASHALSSEFYPTRIRSTGVGWALGIGRIGSIVGPVVGGLLLTQNTPMREVFWAAVIPALIAATAAAGIGAMKRS